MVPNRVALGVGGLEAEPGDHICGVFSGEEERDQVLIPFLQAGLASGDKCICVIDGTSPEEIVATLGPGGEAAALTAGKQLEVIGAADMYLRSGRFSADEVIGAWKAAISDAMYAGQFDVVRAVETWSRREVLPDMQELLMLESEMNRYLPLYPQVIVCLYDIDRFGSGALVQPGHDASPDVDGRNAHREPVLPDTRRGLGQVVPHDSRHRESDNRGSGDNGTPT